MKGAFIIRLRVGFAALALGSLAACASSPAAAQAESAATRGELLYATQCVECHNSQVHWRDRRLATDWDSLAAQVRRWQASALLRWSDADIMEVTRYLNDAIYRFAPPAERVGLAARGRPEASVARR
jgi:mono/diheme cytochrome c family protein